jgi:hypothetical protein
LAGFYRGNKTRKYLGSYKTKVATALAYDKAAKMYYGKFAILNFPMLSLDPCSTVQFASRISEEIASLTSLDTG